MTTKPEQDARIFAAMKSMHTPGPWIVVERYDGSRTVAIMRDYRSVRVGLHVEAAENWVGSSNERQLFANAHLVSAAPDLLAALKGLLAPEPGGVYATNSLIQAARAAVKKAEGGS